VIVITKDEKSGIERQPLGSNLCAFSSAFFLDTAIKLIFDLLDKGEDGNGGDDELELSLELKSGLQGLSVEASKYAAKRSGAKRDFMHLRKEYVAYVAHSSRARRRPPRSRSPSSRVVVTRPMESRTIQTTTTTTGRRRWRLR